ncbi:MAG: S41 family peptidase [Candidatus Heimdallarchaeaceae archaeon]
MNMSFCCEKEISIQPYTYLEMPLDFKIWPEKNTSYMKVQTFDLNIASYTKAFRSFYKQIEGIENLIIDIRGNTGGFYSSWINNIVLPLLSEEEKLQFYLAFKTDDYINCFRECYDLNNKVTKSSFECLPPEVQEGDYNIYDYSFTFSPIYESGFDVEIILLIDNVVYSAAEAFTSFCKQTGFATIYGTTSGGDGITPWPLYYVLPNSKIVIQLPSAMGLDYLGNSNEEVRTQPDVIYESAFGDYNELIEYVLSIIQPF